MFLPFLSPWRNHRLRRSCRFRRSWSVVLPYGFGWCARETKRNGAGGVGMMCDAACCSCLVLDCLPSTAREKHGCECKKVPWELVVSYKWSELIQTSSGPNKRSSKTRTLLSLRIFPSTVMQVTDDRLSFVSFRLVVRSMLRSTEQTDLFFS
jgi:hypothetical protein